MYKDGFGYDATIKRTQDQSTITINGEIFILKKHIYLGGGSNTRGTIVRIVVKPGGTKEYAIKDAWRQSTREPEGDVLKYTTECLRDVWGDLPPKVAVYYNHQDLDTAKSIRKGLKPNGEEPDISHLVMSTVGKRITEYADLRQLLLVLRDALEGLELLFEIGILHRDISINNIIIEPTGHGVIIDLDYAVYTQDLLDGLEKPASYGDWTIHGDWCFGRQ
ncbi:hypothetical protein BC938DRAFT_482676 [Jimgerdemannia flammicorona]|uniref:Protein kinase domain-containing protein n=1 Tax=Jimgerdemannia flammicorona TaxID=994334 RepID=A0A433QDJ6_9FUNG|nr:hypothetical protein BC938DRAFT_482676 [Jimgerdemannia flammicorona]